MYINSIGTNSTSAIKRTGTVNNVGTDFGSVLKSAMSSNTDLDAIFEAASEKYGVPVNLLKAVAKTESNFSPNATSSCGAMGIMQLMPGTAQSLGVSDAYDPEQNIMGGAKYLSGLLSRFGGNTSLAVAAYNAGPGSVTKYNGIPPYTETQNYVKKVLGYCGENISAGKVASEGVKDTVTPELGENGFASLSTLLQMNFFRMQMQVLEGSEQNPLSDSTSDDLL